MSSRQPATPPSRSAAVAVVLVGVIGVCSLWGCSPAAGPGAPTEPPIAQQSSAQQSSAQPSPGSPRTVAAGDPPRPAPGGGPGGLGVADGEVPDGVTVFRDEYPAVTNLDPDLLGALRRAATTAKGDGVEFFVNSGWRSPAYQERLLEQAIARYGSRTEAARWVATPRTSAHVSGDAVDIGPAAAVAWLSEHGPGYGLCQIYRNEPWHYELRTEAAEQGCPARYADPTQDPRMQR